MRTFHVAKNTSRIRVVSTGARICDQSRMDRARRAEPHGNATIWAREIAKNLAGHLDRLSKVHSCIGGASSKTHTLPKLQHKRETKASESHRLAPRGRTEDTREERDLPLQSEERENQIQETLEDIADGRIQEGIKSTEEEAEVEHMELKESRRGHLRLAKLSEVPHASALPHESASGQSKGSINDYHRRQAQRKIEEENEVQLHLM